MSRRSDLQAKLDHLKAIKLSGIKSTSVDNVTVNFDPKVVDQQIAEVEAELNGKRRRPRVLNIRLNG